MGFTTAGVERARIAATGLDIRTGGLLVSGTERITSAGALVNITTLNTHAIPTGTGTLAVSATAPITLSTAGAIGVQRADLLGTLNRVTVTGGTGVLLGTTNATLTLPQDIHTGASPTFVGATLSGITPGSVLFAGTGGVISQNNANLFWDTVNNRLGLGTATPSERLHVVGNILGTGWLRVADGTAAAPALSFSADPDTGLFRPAADALAISTLGTERMRIDASGRVGIGTTIPTELLTINGNLAFLGTRTISTDLVGGHGSGLSITTSAGTGLGNGGNIVIGAGGGGLSGGVGGSVTIHGGDASAATATGGDLTLRGGAAGGGRRAGHVFIRGGQAGSAEAGNVTILSGNAGINNFASGDLTLGTGAPHGTGAPGAISFVQNSNTRMFINSSGNVGIGITDPGARRLNIVATAAGAHPIASAWDIHSDIALKENVRALNRGLKEVLLLQPRSFNLKGDPATSIGFIAQEMKEVIPELVSGEEGQMGISYANLTAVLAKAIQEQQKQINSLFARITTWLADSANGIGEVFARAFHASEKICVDGECLTKDDIRALRKLSTGASATGVANSPAPTPALEQTLEPTPDPGPAPTTEPDPDPTQTSKPAPDPAPTPEPTSTGPAPTSEPTLSP